jgi:hypothetical protein
VGTIATEISMPAGTVMTLLNMCPHYFEHHTTQVLEHLRRVHAELKRVLRLSDEQLAGGRRRLRAALPRLRACSCGRRLGPPGAHA